MFHQKKCFCSHREVIPCLPWDWKQTPDVCFGFQSWVVTPIVWMTFPTLLSHWRWEGMQQRSCQRADEAGAPVNISGLTGKSGKCLVGWSWGDWGTDDERFLVLAWLPASGCQGSLCECHCGKRCSSSPEPPRFSSWTSRSFLAKLKCTVPDCPLSHWIKRAQSQP